MSLKLREILVVDLRGTLLRSDMLFESLWSAFSREWRNPLLSVAALIGGRASLKRHLAMASRVETATLPYDPKVIAFVQAWRESGGRTALVTATDRDLAEAIAAHLGIFDEAHGSDGKLKLKGDRKGQFLEERFGSKGFAYVGDAKADLPVWKRAAGAITVNAPASLRRGTFYDVETDVKCYGRKFSLYLVLGLITTAIFWRTETAFWLKWQTDLMGELGAVLGLSVVCVAKYNLDRCFVFTDRQLATLT